MVDLIVDDAFPEKQKPGSCTVTIPSNIMSNSGDHMPNVRYSENRKGASVPMNRNPNLLVPDILHSDAPSLSHHAEVHHPESTT